MRCTSVVKETRLAWSHMMECSGGVRSLYGTWRSNDLWCTEGDELEVASALGRIAMSGSAMGSDVSTVTVRHNRSGGATCAVLPEETSEGDIIALHTQSKEPRISAINTLAHQKRAAATSTVKGEDQFKSSLWP